YTTLFKMNNQNIHKSENIKKIAHIGIAVKSLEDSLPLYRDVLKVNVEAIEEVDAEKVKVAFLQVGETHLELLEPLEDDSPIQKFIEKRGEGIHHVALEVDDINESLTDMRENGIRLNSEEPNDGAGHAQIAFLHPTSTSGVLDELCEYNKGSVK